jgi:hypothetical protein
MARRLVDHELVLKMIPVKFVDGKTSQARAEGNNAAWNCECGTLLVGRCYFQFGDTCYTKCPGCGKVYRVKGNDKKRAVAVEEEAA